MTERQERTFVNSARRAQIVQAAIDTIAELGYAKASFARITERAGLRSPRMISYHFADKHDLMHTVVVDVYRAGAEFIVERMEKEETAPAKLRTYLEANLDFLRAHPREIAALGEIAPHLRDRRGEPYTPRSAQEPTLPGLEHMLAAGQRSGEFREFDLRSMALLIRGTVDTAAQWLRADEPGRDGSERDEPGLDFDAYTRELVTTIDLATRSR